MRALTPNTPLQFIGVGFRFISWETLRPGGDADRLSLSDPQRHAALMVLEPMHDLDAMLATARMMREEGGHRHRRRADLHAQRSCTTTPSTPTSHGAMAASPDFDRGLYQGPRRSARRRSGTHADPRDSGRRRGGCAGSCTRIATSGSRPTRYTVAADLGVDACMSRTDRSATARRLPSALSTVANLRELGHTVEVDDDALPALSTIISRARAGRGPAVRGTPQDFDARFLHHQVAGGV